QTIQTIDENRGVGRILTLLPLDYREMYCPFQRLDLADTIAKHRVRCCAMMQGFRQCRSRQQFAELVVELESFQSVDGMNIPYCTRTCSATGGRSRPVRMPLRHQSVPLLGTLVVIFRLWRECRFGRRKSTMRR